MVSTVIIWVHGNSLPQSPLEVERGQAATSSKITDLGERTDEKVIIFNLQANGLLFAKEVQ
jgi:hypothetical protein